MIQTEQSATLGVSQDQTLFTPTPINTMVASRTTDEKRTTFGVGKPGDPQFSITSAHEHAVAYGLGRDSFNSGSNAQFTMSIEEEKQPPITERGAGGGMLNNTVNALCQSDWRGIGNQYVNDGKVIIEPHHDTPNR